MNAPTSSQWNLGRFIKTLSYFGAIPWLSSIDWFQQMLGSRPDPRVDSGAIAPPSGTILLMGAATPLGQQVIQQLIQQGYQVRSLTSSEQTTVLGGDPISPELRTEVQAMLDIKDGQAIQSMVEAIAQVQPPTRQTLFDFTRPNTDIQEIWGALDDVVMGGTSESSLGLVDRVALFSGTVSTANSGGFASVRTRNFEPPFNLAVYSGIELRVKGDGNRYKFMLRSENRWDGIAYCYSFDTVADTWVTVRIPFADLIPVFRAKTVKDAGSIDASRITALQLMLSKFEYDGGLNPTFSPGFFQLQVESIGAYGSNPLSQLVLVSAVAEIK